jgi:protein ImuA
MNRLMTEDLIADGSLGDHGLESAASNARDPHRLDRIAKLVAARSVLAELQATTQSAFDPASEQTKNDMVPLGIDDLDGTLAGGLKRTGIHEIFASDVGDETAASGFTAGLSACALRDKPGPVIWIDTGVSANEDGILWPPGLADWGISPNRLIRATARQPRDALRMADDALACSALGAVVLELRGLAPMLDLVALRRLHLQAEARGVPCFLLRFGAEPIASPALTRWSIAARSSGSEARGVASRRLIGHPRFKAALARHRGGALGSWCLEWCSDVQSFVSPAGATLPEPAVSPLQHRSYHQRGVAGAAA